MIENDKNNRELVFDTEQTIFKNKKMTKLDMERNNFSMEPIKKKNSKIFTDVGPYLQQQSISEKENYHLTKKESSSIPKLTKLPSKKLDRKNSIEKRKKLYYLK